MGIERSIASYIEKVCLGRKKMAFLSGPRQCGKTTLGRSLLGERTTQFNWDDPETKKNWIKQDKIFLAQLLNHPRPRVLLDEFHKYGKWKNLLKGFYDLHGDKVEVILTGSARLNQFRKGADSLLGRFFHFHLHPFTIGEILGGPPNEFSQLSAWLLRPKVGKKEVRAEQVKERLFNMGGFPEPYLANDSAISFLWSKSRVELLVRHDLREISHLLSIGQVEILASFLPERVGSPLSIQALKEDLQSSHPTITRWLKALETVYFHYEIKPYSKSIPRSILKEGKIYLYDWAQVEGTGPRFENMVAGHLLKIVDFYNDTGQANLKLYYLRNKERQEIDFLVTSKMKPLFTVEAKLNDLALDKIYLKFQKYTGVPHFQIVFPEGIFRKYSYDEGTAYVISFCDFFSSLP